MRGVSRDSFETNKKEKRGEERKREEKMSEKTEEGIENRVLVEKGC